MTIGPAMKTCDGGCLGTGRIARKQRTLADGQPDPSDIVGKFEETCGKCGGAGVIPERPGPAHEARKGYAADLMVPLRQSPLLLLGLDVEPESPPYHRGALPLSYTHHRTPALRSGRPGARQRGVLK